MDDLITEAERIARWQARDKRECSICHAEPGEPCTYNGQSLGTAMHYQRGRDSNG